MTHPHPIIFGIPEEKIINTISVKKNIVSPLIPGDLSTYIYKNETEYYAQYADSYFAITMKKAGWDCMRHYEIIANGCFPYFINIEGCPPNTMTLWPKELLIEGKNLYDSKFKNKNINDLTVDTIHEYQILIHKLLEHAKVHFTTKSIAKYIIEKANVSNINKILFLSGDTDPDYLRCLTLHGFKEIFGTNCHDYPIIKHIYKNNNIDINSLYGKGMSYSRILDENLHNHELDNTIIRDIMEKTYDIIIYGSYHRGMPYYDLISKIYESNKIILLCGEDIHRCNNNIYVKKGHIVFVREQ